tara:strand:- start:207 stop:611 length:405 start_codon:yes stop_codon:yes gene_type:complete
MHLVKKGKGPLAGHKKAKSWVRKKKNQLADIKSDVKQAYESDKNPFQKIRNDAAGIANKKKASGRIQDKLVSSGHSRTSLRKKGEAHRKSQKARADMQKLRRNDPEEYKKQKKEQRRKERLKAFTQRGNSSSWD